MQSLMLLREEIVAVYFENYTGHVVWYVCKMQNCSVSQNGYCTLNVQCLVFFPKTFKATCNLTPCISVWPRLTLRHSFLHSFPTPGPHMHHVYWNLTPDTCLLPISVPIYVDIAFPSTFLLLKHLINSRNHHADLLILLAVCFAVFINKCVLSWA